MKLYITINNIDRITLPISYHHIQQSVIYALIKGNLHDKGMPFGKRDYKMFTFGPIEGRYTINNRQITFYDSVSFEFRCCDENVVEKMVKNIELFGIRFGDISYHNVDIVKQNYQIQSERIKIKMKSPICAYETDESKHTIFYSPKEERFYQYVTDNFERKFTAWQGYKPDTKVE